VALTLRRKVLVSDQPRNASCYCLWNEYTKLLNKAADVEQFIRSQYAEIFGKPVPPNINPVLLDTANQYELQRRGYALAKKPFPEKMKERCSAAVHFNLSGLSKHMQTLLKLRMTEVSMAKKATEVKSKTMKNSKHSFKKLEGKNGLGASESWYRFLLENFKLKETDEKISKKMKDNFPGRKSKIYDQVQLIRNLFNKGRLTGQNNTPPAKPSIRYNEKGLPWMSPTAEAKATKKAVKAGKEPKQLEAPKKLTMKRGVKAVAEEAVTDA